MLDSRATIALATTNDPKTVVDRPRAIMISAIVLAPDLGSHDDPVWAREAIIRSLGWLVSAVVSGVVREVTLGAPDRLDLADVVDQSGCGLVRAERERDRLAAAVATSRCERLLVIRSGFLPDAGLVDELAALLRRPRDGDRAILRAAPETVWQRLFPDRAPVVGVLLPLEQARRVGSFERLAKAARRAPRLRARAWRID